MASDYVGKLIKQFGLGYGMPLFLFISAVVALVGGQPLILSEALVGIALVWLLVYRLKYLRHRAALTGSGKLGFYVARVEEDPGNKRQKGLFAELFDGITAHAELKEKVEVHDLRQTIPYGAL